MSEQKSRRLDPPVDPTRDRVLGRADAPITLVEYGSYACPRCRQAHEAIARLRDELGDKVRYVFRHKPLAGNPLALQAAELVEQAQSPDRFWQAHADLMAGSAQLTEADLARAQADLQVEAAEAGEREKATERARARVQADIDSARASGAVITPTFFINGRLYGGAWDDTSFREALLGSLGYRLRTAALDFAAWSPAIGALLLLATITAIVLANSAMGEAFNGLWQRNFGFSFGDAEYRLPLLKWVNDGLLSIFFLVVGLEIKREFTIGHLSSRRLAALPVAAAVGGMVAPAVLYALVIPAGPWGHGWGVPMATDTAFAIALIAMLGSRVPVELRIFLTAVAIVDDIGAITVVALFYSGDLDVSMLAAAGATLLLLLAFNKAGIYRVAPYLLAGAALWFFVHEGGLHATVAGVLLAMVIPTRPPPNLAGLMAQADAVFYAEMEGAPPTSLGHRLSAPALSALDEIHDRLESPAAHVLRRLEPHSSYVVLPIFALANAGVVVSAEAFRGHGVLFAAIGAGLVLGKPIGMFVLAFLAVRFGVASKPDAYSWSQVAGAGSLAGIGFTMSLFIAGQAFPAADDFAAAKIAIFGASFLSGVIGVSVLCMASRNVRSRAAGEAGIAPNRPGASMEPGAT